MTAFTIGIVSHPTKDVGASVDLIREWTSQNDADVVLLTDDVAGVDAVVALGGDGTMLGAMRMVAGASEPIPVIGVNYGNLGFLVEVEPQELPKALERITSQNFQLEPHHALELAIDGVPYLAFNDIAIARRPGEGVVSADLSVNDVPYGYYRADGLVICTSAGSTAYNYAAGGPVLSPAVAASVVTPVAPMTGIDRSIVLSDSEDLQLAIGEGTRAAAVEVDGRIVTDVSEGSILTVHLRRDAAMVVRLDAARHANKGRLKLSLLDLPLRRDQLLQLIPAELRERAGR